MNFLRVLGMVVYLMILFMRVIMLMVLKTIAMSAVRWGGLFWLKPFMIGSMMEWKAVVVECLDLKLCWWVHCGKWGLMIVWMVDSRTLVRGERRAIGQYRCMKVWIFIGFQDGHDFCCFLCWGYCIGICDVVEKFGDDWNGVVGKMLHVNKCEMIGAKSFWGFWISYCG